MDLKQNRYTEWLPKLLFAKVEMLFVYILSLVILYTFLSTYKSEVPFSCAAIYETFGIKDE